LGTPSEKQLAIDKKNEHIYFALFALGGLIGVLQLASPVGFGSGFEMVALGKNLAEKGSFANPFSVLATGPTAANPPLYPAFLALLTVVLRMPGLILLAAMIGNIVANAFTAAWLPRVSGLFYGDVRPGILASFLWLAAAPLMPSWDASFTVAGLLLFCILSASSLRMDKGRVSAITAGLAAGALFLLNPSSLLISIPWIAYLVLNRRALRKQTAILLATLFVTIFLWAGRNYIQLGSFVVRTNLGMTLYASNNDCAESSMIADESNNCFQTHHPNISLKEAQLLRELGEVRYDRKRTADAVSWIKAHRSRFEILTMDRVREFWFPPLIQSPFKAGIIGAITILSIPGLILMIYKRERITPFVLSVLLIYPSMYYVVVSDVRYRYPVLWLSLLPAGYFLWSVYCRMMQLRIFQHAAPG
jgi:hypothetical protein